ncbi:MAG: glycosyltransferase family 4 protein, partial [Parcubacteria group bacterium]|nr:glycosyltransferase family 4 protein [Parcubacteria group bacterium]
MRIALVHDHLTQLGGAEKVLLTMLKLFPRADIYTINYSRRKTLGLFAPYERRIHISFIQRLPGDPRWY